MDVGCYCVSGSRLLAGEPVRRRAAGARRADGVDMRLAGTLVFPGERARAGRLRVRPALRQGLEAVGSEGSLRVATPVGHRGAGHRAAARRTRSSGSRSSRPTATGSQSDNFSRAVRGLEPPLLGRADALGQARAIDALYRSAEPGGEPVTLCRRTTKGDDHEQEHQVTRYAMKSAESDAGREPARSSRTRAVFAELAADEPGNVELHRVAAARRTGLVRARVARTASTSPGARRGLELSIASTRAPITPSSRGKAPTSIAELMGGDGTVPLMFFFRDHDANQLMIVQG